MSIQSERGYVVSSGRTSDGVEFVVREKICADGQVQLVIHKRVKGEEIIPRGYVLGSNALLWSPRS